MALLKSAMPGQCPGCVLGKDGGRPAAPVVNAVPDTVEIHVGSCEAVLSFFQLQSASLDSLKLGGFSFMLQRSLWSALEQAAKRAVTPSSVASEVLAAIATIPHNALQTAVEQSSLVPLLLQELQGFSDRIGPGSVQREGAFEVASCW